MLDVGEIARCKDLSNFDKGQITMARWMEHLEISPIITSNRVLGAHGSLMCEYSGSSCLVRTEQSTAMVQGAVTTDRPDYPY